MSKKDDKDKRRKQKLREREQGKKARKVVIHDGEKKTVIEQGSTKGYDIEMIRDFLDHLLLELRVQHFENQKLLKTLGTTDDLDSAMKEMEKTSENLVRQFVRFQQKYQTALIASNAFDGANASDAESKGVITAVVKAMLAKRDEQIGHLEALKELFAEALQCAKLPFGVDQAGNPVQPHRVHRVRDISDDAFVSHLPTYEELLPFFSDHDLARGEGIGALKNHDQNVPIVASRDDGEDYLVLYGADVVERQKQTGQSTVPATVFPVSSYNELRFVIAAIAKFVGVPSTDGTPWQDL
jgi:hypothetical protein